MNPKQEKDWILALRVFARLSAWIAFPIVLGAFLGKWLDNKYDSSPRYFLIVVGLSFVVSIFGLVKNTLKEYKKLESDLKKEEEEEEIKE